MRPESGQTYTKTPEHLLLDEKRYVSNIMKISVKTKIYET